MEGSRADEAVCGCAREGPNSLRVSATRVTPKEQTQRRAIAMSINPAFMATVILDGSWAEGDTPATVESRCGRLGDRLAPAPRRDRCGPVSSRIGRAADR